MKTTLKNILGLFTFLVDVPGNVPVVYNQPPVVPQVVQPQYQVPVARGRSWLWNVAIILGVILVLVAIVAGVIIYLQTKEPSCECFNGTCKDGECICFQGFTGDKCQTSDACSRCVNGACTVTADGFPDCKCNPGYDGTWCDEDINECSINNGMCEGQCINLLHSYRCTCSEGFTLSQNMHTCIEIDSCAKHDCSKHGQCISEDGGQYTCSCQPGYTGQYCASDLNECLEANGRCEGHCKNTFGSFKCSCGDGQVLGPDLLSCQDINECDTANGLCEGNCLNTNGSFSCSCDEGFQVGLDLRSCQALPLECTEGTCENGVCLVGTEGVHCQCHEGWEGAACDQAYDYCKSSPCVYGTCTNEDFGYSCNCFGDYSGYNCDIEPGMSLCELLCSGGYCDGDECLCYEGYSGRWCDTQSECSARCDAGSCDGESCICYEGFTGTWCDEVVTPCVSYEGPCSSNAECCDGIPCTDGSCEFPCTTAGSCDSDFDCCRGYICNLGSCEDGRGFN